jgi:hypothetical protein
MKRLLSFVKKYSRMLAVLPVAVMLFVMSGAWMGAFAETSNPPPTVVIPCAPLAGVIVGSSPGATSGFINQYECHYYDFLKYLGDQYRDTIQFAVVLALLDSMTFFTQKVADNLANWVLTGAHGNPQFYDKDFEGFLKDVTNDVINREISAMNDQYFKKELGFDLCQPISLQLKIALGLGKISRIPPPNCTFSRVKDSFNRTAQSLDREQLAATLRQSIQPGSNDINISLMANQKFLQNLANTKQNNILNRQEGGGLKLMTDIVSGRIRMPSQVAKDTLSEGNMLKRLNANVELNTNVMAQEALVAGIAQLPLIGASTFVNTIALAGLNKLFAMLLPNPTDDVIPIDLTLEDTDPNAETGSTGESVAERKKRIISAQMSDIFRPNLNSSENQDFVVELSSCPEPRGMWSCSMDQGLAGALRTVGDAGAITVGRASGLTGNVTPFLHTDWELIPEWEIKDNQDTGCFQRAYCAVNLAKMRFARILPIGWELAANSVYNKKHEGKYITLGQVIQGFDDCNDKGQADEQHPWCKLINPNWPLTAPPFRCQIKAFGNAIIGQGPGKVRTQECTDVVSCLKRDDKGNCVGGYGYCTSDKTVWRFGADQCEEKFASCRTYVKPSKQLGTITGNSLAQETPEYVSYVRNTVDYASCSADNAGCMFYATKRDVSTTSTDRWVGTVTSDWKIQDTSKASAPRVYFDKTVQTCDPSNDGCTKVLAVKDGQSALNLLQNGSFEQKDDTSPTKLLGWAHYALSPDRQYVFDAQAKAEVFVGGAGLKFVGSTSKSLTQVVKVEPTRNYVMSLFGKDDPDTAGAGALQIKAGFLKPYKSGSKVVAPDGTEFEIYTPKDNEYYKSAGCTYASALSTNKSGSGADWDRESCEFSTPVGVTGLLVEVEGMNGAYVDAAQLEEGTVVSPFVDGVSGQLEPDYLKIAPEELACSGAATDRAECKKFAQVCQQTEAGCQAYKETLSGDSTEIPANLTAADYCPTSCVGYAEYRKQPSAFDLTKTAVSTLNDPADDMIEHFIPAYALQCSAAEVGCEEFTNIEAQSAGGEGKAYFNYVRACQKPSDKSKTFFTWEGSESAGYQLKTWSLVSSSTAPTYDDVNSVVSVTPEILEKVGLDGQLKAPSSCNATLWKSGMDPDCRQFYNEAGQTSYRYFSQTIISSPDCKDYRKNDSNKDDCEKTGGSFVTATKQCIYPILAAQSAVCSATNAGCRAYIGTTGRNTQLVQQETFAGATSTYMDRSAVSVKYELSKEALLVGDYSLKVSRANTGPYARMDFAATTGSMYTVSFWAKTTATGASPVYLSVVSGATEASIGTVNFGVEWQRFEVGPFYVKDGGTLKIQWAGMPKLPAVSFLDQIEVRRLKDAVFIRKGTWAIPPECDRTVEGVPQPQAMLGCREYSDRKGRIVSVREFNRLCRFEKVGCSAYVDTRNSDSPYAEVFDQTGSAAPASNGRLRDNLFVSAPNIVRPADRYVYLIDEPSAHCDSAQASCRSFGKPKFTASQKLETASATSTSFDTIYLIDDIKKYRADGEPNMLCRPSELFCDTFNSGNTVSYFRDPSDHVCEWKDNVVLEAASFAGSAAQPAYSYPLGQYSGWFVKNSSPSGPCYPHLLSGGKSFLMEYPFSTKYAGWTSLCPKDQSECTEFRDGNDHSDPEHPVGKPYYFINNNRVDKASCAGQVDVYGGCVLMRDMNNGTLDANSKATYAQAKAKGNVAVSPINCKTDQSATAPASPFCKNVGACVNWRKEDPYPAPDDPALLNSHLNEVCTVNADCTFKGLTLPYTNSAGKSVQDTVTYIGDCQQNDSNTVVKVKLDRDCQTWLGCKSGETVYDDSQQKYVDVCSEYALCDQVGGASQGNFCAHYIDRNYPKNGSVAPTPKITDPSVDKVQKTGRFLNQETYAERLTDFTSPEYAGYSIPNRFQVADFMSRRVGYELLAKRPSRKEYVDDYRMVAAVPRVEGGFGVLDLTPGKAIPYIDPAYPDLSLCQHIDTKQMGYYIPGESPARCYLAIDSTLTQVVSDLKGATGSSRNAQIIATALDQNKNAKSSVYLNQIMPGAECKAQPDAQAPFGNEYVTEWDNTVQPAKPKKFLATYDGVVYCEKGQDCVCQYAKVNYGTGLTKYYDPNSLVAPPQGICVGGRKDGQACIPDEGSTSENSFSTDAIEKAQAAAANNSCGTNGKCQALSTISYIRGISGYCLQRDPAITTGIPGRYQCLVWHPSPVMNGTKNVYHYDPAVGYQRALNSGEYYCAAPVFGAKTGITTDKNGFQKPGASDDGGWMYDQQCVSGSYKASVTNVVAQTVAIEQKPSQNDVLHENPPSHLVNNKATETARTDCKILDGTDLRQTDMAEACAASKLQIARNHSSAVYLRTQTDDLDSDSADTVIKNYATFFPTGALGFALVTGDNFLQTWKSALGAAWGSFACFVSDCYTDINIGTYSVDTQYEDRATYAVPTMNGKDDQTIRLISTGEGPDKNYAEYFITADSPFMSKILAEMTNTPGATGSLLESQVGYFRFHIPQPGISDEDFSDEASWSTKPPLSNVYDDAYCYYIRAGVSESNCSTGKHKLFYTHTTSNGLTDLEPDTDIPIQDFSQVLAGQAYSLKEDAIEDTDAPTDAGDAFGILGCLASPEWADVQMSLADFSDETKVKESTAEWYKTFSKYFNKGILSRANGGYLKNQAGNSLLQLPCQSAGGNNCYYKYWELDYRADDKEKFTMFGYGDGRPGPTQVNAQTTFFKKSEETKSYFAIRAMFEDMSRRDNETTPTEMPIDGSRLEGPFKFVGFWVTAAAPGTQSSRSIYMRVSAATANSCRDVAQVVSPIDRKNAAFTDRLWDMSGYTVPGLRYTLSTENAPFGAALHQRMIGRDPMLMLDTTKGLVGADGTFIKPGQQYVSKDNTNTLNSTNDSVYSTKIDDEVYNYYMLTNLFARVYQVYSFYDVPVKKGDSMCFFGPLAGRYCEQPKDCNPNGECLAGRCKGGVFHGSACQGFQDCEFSFINANSTYQTDVVETCASVDGPAKITKTIDTSAAGKIDFSVDCKGQGDPNSSDPDKDNNRCTHGVGYFPRPDICATNPSNEICLQSLPLSGSSIAGYYFKGKAAPTDVTIGTYGLAADGKPINHEGTASSTEYLNNSNYRKGFFIDSYFPKAPRIAAPDTSRQCAAPGQCSISKVNSFSVDDASEGQVIYFGSQVQSTLRFYAWASDDQAPLTDIWVDWGDGTVQKVTDGRIKNHKPFCGVAKQCENIPGLSCSSDADCPANAGKCVETGSCSADPGRSCFKDSQCGTTGGNCVKRLTYGNSPNDCEQNYFEFSHSYNCTAANKPTSACPATGSPTNKQSCYATAGNNTAVCRFLPKVFVKDNWGWCTGSCGQYIQNPPAKIYDIAMRGGGCYDGSQLNNPTDNMCDAEKAHLEKEKVQYDPWIPYSGYIEIRSNQ